MVNFFNSLMTMFFKHESGKLIRIRTVTGTGTYGFATRVLNIYLTVTRYLYSVES